MTLSAPYAVRPIPFLQRRAWIDHVLARPDGPDIRGYFGARLNAHELAG